MSLPNTLRSFAHAQGAMIADGNMLVGHACAPKSIGSNTYTTQFPDCKIDASRVLPTAGENRPINVNPSFIIKT